MNLTEAISNMRSNPTEDNSKAFADTFRALVDDNAQVYTTAKASGTGYAIDTAEHTGNIYVLMYSDSGKLEKKEGSKSCTIGLSDLINSAYANPHIAGIVINPNEDPVYIQRKDLQIMSGKDDPRLKSRDWGKGIPEYTDADLMVAEEAIDFAIEIVAVYGVEPEGYKIVEVNNGLTAFPNLVLEKEGQLYFVTVDVAVAPNMPKFNRDAKDKIIEIAKEHNAKVLYAPVSFGSADEERMAKGLALNGDEFIGTFLGFIEIK